MIPVTNDKTYSQDMRYKTLSQDFLNQTWASFCEPPIKLTLMNVKETATWVLMLSSFKGWVEAKAYSESFEMNSICGWMLQHLTHAALRDELGIDNLSHQRDLIEAVKQNELTLTNPIIKSLLPISFFTSENYHRN